MNLARTLARSCINAFANKNYILHDKSFTLPLFPHPLKHPYSVFIRCPVMQEQIISLTDFKTSASQLLQETRGGANIILTQHGWASGVVQDYATYRKQQDTFLLLKLMVQGEADAQKARVTPQIKVFDSLRTSLLKQQKQRS